MYNRPHLNTDFQHYHSNSLTSQVTSNQIVKAPNYRTYSTVKNPYNYNNTKLELPEDMSYVNSIVLPSHQHNHFSQQVFKSNLPPIITSKSISMFNNAPISTAMNDSTTAVRDNIKVSTNNKDNDDSVENDSKKQETVLCLKRLFTFLLSHVGLAVLVVVYTVIGGSMFYAVERDHESQVKMKMFETRKKIVEEMMLEWRNTQLELLDTLINHVNIIHQFEQTNFGRKFKNQTNLYDSIERLAIINSEFYKENNKRLLSSDLKDEQKQHLAGLSWYLSSLGWSKRILPQWWFHRNYTQFTPLQNLNNTATADIINELHGVMTNNSTNQPFQGTDVKPTDSVTNRNDYALHNSYMLKTQVLTTTTPPPTTTTTATRVTSPDSDEINTKFENNTKTNHSLHLNYFSTELINSLPKHLILVAKLDDILPTIINQSRILENALQKKLTEYVEQIVIAIKDEGWNGSEHTDDFNWTFEGSILFAVTIITTIGKLKEITMCICI
ncbi:unnamed protein product [Trichobilharzia szidati]|nr:unnamed protein product [Trichobilharzia szidati]